MFNILGQKNKWFTKVKKKDFLFISNIKVTCVVDIKLLFYELILL